MLDVIRKFVSMAIVVRFDSMYADSLSETSIKRAVNKFIKVDYKRYMGKKYHESY